MCFRVNYNMMVGQINPDDITSYLYSEHIITDAEKDEISHEMLPPRKRAEKLLNAVHRAIRVNKKVFYRFVSVLSKTEKYKPIASQLSLGGTN